jgi:hypothetical protein
MQSDQEVLIKITLGKYLKEKKTLLRLIIESFIEIFDVVNLSEWKR